MQPSCPATLKPTLSRAFVSLIVALFSTSSCLGPTLARSGSNSELVKLTPIELDSRNPERKQFGALTLLSAFQLQSKDKRFGGLSGLSIGSDGKLYAISDRGYWLSATMEVDRHGALTNLVGWQIAPLLTPTNTPVSGRWRDAEALARAPDGSFFVGFEEVHRIWRYSPPPETFQSLPLPIPVPATLAKAPSNGGIEGLAIFADGRLLVLTEEFLNPDGSFKGWIIDNGGFTELSYFPAPGYRVTDAAALPNGDVVVLERRLTLLTYFSARLMLLKAEQIVAGSRLSGKELLELKGSLAVENYEGIAVHPTENGTMLFIVSDDNYNAFEGTLLLQFLLPAADDGLF